MGSCPVDYLMIRFRFPYTYQIITSKYCTLYETCNPIVDLAITVLYLSLTFKHKLSVTVWDNTFLVKFIFYTLQQFPPRSIPLVLSVYKLYCVKILNIRPFFFSFFLADYMTKHTHIYRVAQK